MPKRYITEMGMGTDVHGQDYTRAERAVFDAILLEFAFLST